MPHWRSNEHDVTWPHGESLKMLRHNSNNLSIAFLSKLHPALFVISRNWITHGKVKVVCKAKLFGGGNELVPKVFVTIVAQPPRPNVYIDRADLDCRLKSGFDRAGKVVSSRCCVNLPVAPSDPAERTTRANPRQDVADILVFEQSIHSTLRERLLYFVNRRCVRRFGFGRRRRARLHFHDISCMRSRFRECIDTDS